MTRNQSGREFPICRKDVGVRIQPRGNAEIVSVQK